jgi:predicted lysophospholipase L1 biosynthesis ABC-type transport system permease subunit
VAVALGESEARPDLRTLLTLGADRRLRRRVTAARGAVLALLAGVLAVPAGLLPVWGVLLNSPLPIVVPVPEVIGAIVVLPLMAIVGGLLLGRPLDERSPRADRAG